MSGWSEDILNSSKVVGFYTPLYPVNAGGYRGIGRAKLVSLYIFLLVKELYSLPPVIPLYPVAQPGNHGFGRESASSIAKIPLSNSQKSVGEQLYTTPANQSPTGLTYS